MRMREIVDFYSRESISSLEWEQVHRILMRMNRLIGEVKELRKKKFPLMVVTGDIDEISLRYEQGYEFIFLVLDEKFIKEYCKGKKKLKVVLKGMKRYRKALIHSLEQRDELEERVKEI